MKESIELVIFPAPGIGHLISTVEIAKLLVEKEDHISITIIILKQRFDLKTDSYIQSQTTTGSNRVTFVTLHVENTNFGTPSMVLIDSYKPQIRDCVEEIIRTGGGSKRLGGFVVDMFTTAMIDLANEFAVPAYVFYTSGAAVYGFLLHLQSIMDDYEENLRGGVENDLNISTYANPFPAKLLPSPVLDKDGFKMLHSISKRIGTTKGVMVNTFLELEPHAIKTLCEDPMSPPVYPIGPVLNLEGCSKRGNEGESSEHIFKWLDGQEDGSVVFLCFGSEGYFPEEQVREIAIALERSGHRFLWALRRAPEKDSRFPSEYNNLDEVLPEGFLQRTQSVGKVIGWAPQVAILQHRAVGGFVSHCGWNSTLESIWFGKPIGAWPIYAEQQANAFEIVKEMGVGVEIKMDYRKDFKDATKFSNTVKADEIERGIRSLMDPLNPIRLKAKGMSEKSRVAVMEGGSSDTSIQRFLEDVFSNIN